MFSFGISNFLSYMKKKDVLTAAISFVIAALMKEIIFKFSDEIVKPLTGMKKKKEEKVVLGEYIILIVNLIIISYLLYLMDTFLGEYF